MPTQDKLHVTLTDELLETTEFVGNISRVTLNGNELIANNLRSTKLLIWLFGVPALVLGYTALHLGFEIHSALESVNAACSVCGKKH
jgi:hypothetical protein